ncbi:MAG TPA: DNA-binding protein [archaeon]|nr:DNA-binding protein [archaeon]
MPEFDPTALQQTAQAEAMKQQVLRAILSKDALERLGRVRLVNPNLAAQAELYLLTVAQQGKLSGQITDSQLREVLQLLSQKKETRIRRV